MAPLSTLNFGSLLDDQSTSTSSGDSFATMKTKSALSSPVLSKKEKTSRKAITFARSTQSCPTIHIDDYSEEEKNAMWYNKDEITTIRQMATIEANSQIPGTYLRGLESKTPGASRKKRQIRMAARCAVIFEQEFQDEEGVVDAEAIADAYFECCEGSIIEAQMTALRDEREAMIVHGRLLRKKGGNDLGVLQTKVSNVSPTATTTAAAVAFVEEKVCAGSAAA